MEVLEKPSLDVALTTLLLIYNFQFRSAFQPTMPVSRLTTCTENVSSCETGDLEPMTLTIKFGLDNVNLNQHAKYPSKSSFRSKIIVWTDPTSTIRMVEPRRREIRLANLNN